MIAETPVGCRRLIEALDRAVQAPTTEQVGAQVKACLEELIGDGAVKLPPELEKGCPESYARRLIHRSEEHGYTALAMIWEPGQGTPLHDHAGMWCVEGVLEGQIEVVQHELLEQKGDRMRFRPEGRMFAGKGSAGSLIPPFEYHTIANPPGNGTAITIHVYGGEMTRCTIFEPEGNGWFRKRTRELAYTA